MSTEDHSQGQYYVFTNDESHGSVRGIETSLSRMSGSNLSGQVFYTLSIAKGRYSSMLSRFNYAQSGVVYESREDNYLDWDQTHQAGATVDYRTFQSEDQRWPVFPLREFCHRRILAVRQRNALYPSPFGFRAGGNE